MKQGLLLIAGFFFFSLQMSGQNEPPLKAWLESQSIDGKQVITGWCQNNTASAARFFYRATMWRDTTAIVKEGATFTIPGQPNLLLNAYFVIPEGQFSSVVLELKNHEKIVATATLVHTPALTAQTEEPTGPLTTAPSTRPSFLEIEIEGLIIDETRSKLAHDFYEIFYNLWSTNDAPPGNYTITLREFPARIGIGTMIVVDVDGEQLGQFNLQPRIEAVESLAAQLSEALTNFLTNPENSVRELQADDLTGSGIY